MLSVKQTLFTRWNFMRFLRLGFGIFFVIQAIQRSHPSIGLAGGFFLFTALTNTGCWAGGACALPGIKSASTETEEIFYEEAESH